MSFLREILIHVLCWKVSGGQERRTRRVWEEDRGRKGQDGEM